MRTIPFKQILHGVAYKFGLDPEQSNFLTNQAISIGRSIDEWVQRLWASADFPEWAVTHQFIPDTNHLVPWDARAVDDVAPPSLVGAIHSLGRVLRVDLIDPRSNYYVPTDTPFVEQDEGLHVGFEHGQAVWIQYLPPPTRFTAEQWLGNLPYGKGDVVYSNRTGECYTSKAAGNLGHDPAFVPPPTLPDTAEPPHSVVPPPAVDTSQQRTSDNPGLGPQNQIYLINFDEFKPRGSDSSPFHIPDPPVLNSDFYVDIRTADNTLLGEGGPIPANGVDTLQSIMAALAASLQTSLGVGWTVTSGPKTITVEHDSVFQTAQSFFTPPIGYPYYFPIAIASASYVPATTGTAGVPQQTTITLTEEQVLTGATYWIVFRGQDGTPHNVQYTAMEGDSMSQILIGLSGAIEAARADDDYFNSVSPSVNPSDGVLSMDISDTASVNTVLVPAGSPWWELNLFPRVLANPVMRGATADLLKEWGSTDKGLAEEQAVPQEQGMATNQFDPQQTPLTDQDRARSRYKL